MSAPGTIVIVGAGQAGFQTAASLRESKFDGRIVLLGDEPGLPYQRPPLSKVYLGGKADPDTVALRPASFYAQHGIELRSGSRAVAIDRSARELGLSSGERLAYDHLVLATGARNRVLPVPGAALDGIVALRTLAEAEDVKSRLDGARRLVIVGAGFIGLEVAAVAAARGLDVTVLEATARPMSRAVSMAISDFVREAHERAGVTFAFGAVAVRVDGRGGRACGVEVSDGRLFPADLVLVGIGVVPNAELAGDAGLPIANGIVVGEQLTTGDPAISAIGDCASFPSPFVGNAPVRLESVQNAVDQARCVAARLTGRPAPYAATPWFWSDQGVFKLQIAGLAQRHDRIVLRGKPEDGAFSVFCFQEGRLAAIESINRPGDHMAARQLLAGNIPLTPEQAADSSFDLRAYVAALRRAA